MSPESDSLVILLHGVGANGADLADVGVALRRSLPGAAFVSPDAPEPFDQGGPPQRQWFSVSGVTAANRSERVERARQDFDRIVRAEIEEAGLTRRLDRVAFFGFSQGAIMALDAVARGAWPVAACVAASGRLATKPGLEAARGTPVLILHGVEDEVVPVAEAEHARRGLEDAGFSVETHLYLALGHALSVEGLRTAGAFLARRLRTTV